LAIKDARRCLSGSFHQPVLAGAVWAVPMSDQLRDALTLAQEKRDRADVEHRLAALAAGASFRSGLRFSSPRQNPAAN